MEYGSPEHIEYIKNLPRHPRTKYVDDVENCFAKLSTFQLWELFLEQDAKTDADYTRILELAHDCFDDGTSVEDCASMIVDFCKAHKYIK
jgi:hypothetical protein